MLSAQLLLAVFDLAYDLSSESLQLLRNRCTIINITLSGSNLSLLRQKAMKVLEFFSKNSFLTLGFTFLKKDRAIPVGKV